MSRAAGVQWLGVCELDVCVWLGGPPVSGGLCPAQPVFERLGRPVRAPAIAAVCAFRTGLRAWVSACTRVSRRERALVLCASSLRVFRCTFASLCPCVRSTAHLLVSASACVPVCRLCKCCCVFLGVCTRVCGGVNFLCISV